MTLSTCRWPCATDEDGDFGGKTTGRVAAVWRPAKDWTLRAVAGTGFRAPSLFERFSTQYGDPGLQPEESESYEVGVERQFENGRLEATVFRIAIDNLIGFPSLDEGYVQVPGTTVSKGIELTGEAVINPFLSIHGNYTYTDAKDPDGMQRVRTPRHDAVLGLEADLLPRLQGRLDIRHVADVRASSFAPVDNKVGDYTIVGTGLNYAVTDDTTAYLRVENLFDADYETAGGFNTSGRAAYAGLRASF